MRQVINVITRKDNDKIQIVTNINYDQNSFFLKQLIAKSKWHQIKTILRKNKTSTSLGKKYGSFSQCDSIREEEKSEF